MSETLLSIKGLKKSFGNLEVLKGLSTDIFKGFSRKSCRG